MVRCFKKLKIIITVLLITSLSSIPAYALDINVNNSKLIDKLSKYSIVMYSKQINGIKGYSHLANNVEGVTDYRNRRIIIHDSKDDSRNRHILNHEEGHVFDTWDMEHSNSKTDLPCFYSYSNEFQIIFDKEKESISKYSLEEYSQLDISEYFAECFAWYLEEPDKLKESSPMTYEFINKVYTNY